MNDRENLATLAAVLMLEATTTINPCTGAPVCAAPHVAARDAVTLTRLAREMATAAVRQCNGEGTWQDGRWQWGEEDDNRLEAKKDRIRRRVLEIGAKYGIKGVTLGGDPRGWVLRLHLKSGKTNGMGDGWGVG